MNHISRYHILHCEGHGTYGIVHCCLEVLQNNVVHPISGSGAPDQVAVRTVAVKSLMLSNSSSPAQSLTENSSITATGSDVFALNYGIPHTIIREAGLLRGLSHPNIISLHEILVGTTYVHLVFDFCSFTLHKVICEADAAGERTMDPTALRSYCYQLFSAISCCHENGCMHRDIKPANILLDATKRSLKLADFGMAR